MNPGRSAETMTCLPSSAARLADRPRRLVRGRRAADQLDERHDRHGAEEVHPDESGAPRRARPPRPGGRSRSSSCSRRRSRARARARRAPRHSAGLTSASSKTASIDEVRVGDGGRDRRRRDRAPASRRAPRRQRALVDRRSRLPAIRSRPASRPGEVRLVQDDLLADRRVDLGDAVAHQAGAGHEDALDRHPGSLPGCSATDRPRPSESATGRPQEHAAAERDAADTRKIAAEPARPAATAPSDAGRQPEREVEEQRSSSRRPVPAPSRPTRDTASADERRERERDRPTRRPRSRDRGRPASPTRPRIAEPERRADERRARQARRPDLVGQLARR